MSKTSSAWGVLGRASASLVAAGVVVTTLAAPAAATPQPGGTGLHSGMMPADSPDAKVTASASNTTRPGYAAATAGAVAVAPLGIDVSGHQHPSGAAIDWAKVAASGQKFAIVKATELYTDDTTQLPVLYTNPYLTTDLNAAHAHGLVVASYAFAHPENSATDQADDFAAAIGTLPVGSLPPVLDLEETGGLTVSQLVAWTHTFLNRLEADTGVLPMIYTSPSFWATYLGGATGFSRYPLWEAHYTTAAEPYQIGGWATYTLWQFSDKATISGVSTLVDQDRFNAGTGATLTNLHMPTGSLDSAVADATGRLTVRGWTIDPDTPTTPTLVPVYVDGHGVMLTANGWRPDVGAVYPYAGNRHGFSDTLEVGPGAHTVCAYAMDTSSSAVHTGLRCARVTVTPHMPIGSFDSAVVDSTGRLTVRGWTIDPDTPATPTLVPVYVDGHGVMLTANGWRPDVGAVYPYAGNRHGFSDTLEVGPGAHTVCAYAVDTSFPALHTGLRCINVIATAGLPFGSFDSAVVDSAGRLTVRGWTIDPDTPTTPTLVPVYVDGRGVMLTANGWRPDVGSRYPYAGSRHGFSATLTVGPGPHTVCAYAIDTSYPSRHSSLRCLSAG